MSANEQLTSKNIRVEHGKLSIQVPRIVFHGPESIVDENEWNRFKNILKSRYPWLTENALELIKNNSRKEFLRVLWDEKKGAQMGRELLQQGYLERSIEHLQSYLKEHPDDCDAWYALGESLCKAGRNEEGYRSFQRGRDLF